MKSKDDFLAEMSEVYDKISETLPTTTHDECEMLDSLNDPNMLIEMDCFESRKIYLDKEIDINLSTQILKKISFWENEDEALNIPQELRVPIQIFINTPGGDINAVYTIIDAIQTSRTPVHTITYGCGYSGGFFIGICGHKRFGCPHSSYLFHEGMTMMMGDSHKFLQQADFYQLQLSQLKEIVLNNTLISEDEYERKKKDDWYFNSKEALKYGIIDEIIKKENKE